MTAPRLLLWCLAGAVLVELVIARAAAGNPSGFSPIFWYLLTTYDTHGNLLLFATVACAFFLRRQSAAIAAIGFAAERPWTLAAAALPLLCLGSLRVYHDQPLSMDEYAGVFQAKAFAAGRLSGSFPPELLGRLIPEFFHGIFFNVSHASGEVSSAYSPGFALLLAPFAWLGIPWAANPAIGALTIPAVHRLARQVTGSQEAGGWAAALTLASPAFVATSISYYSMSAHMLFNVLYALLLLRPTAARALLAGLVGSVALTLHQQAPHLLFCLPFVAWLLFRPGRVTILGALALGYLPLALLLGAGWHYHLLELRQPAEAVAAVAAPSEAAVMESITSRFSGAASLPQWSTIDARIAGLSKIWTWGAAGLLALAAAGFGLARAGSGARLLGAALAVTFFGYFLYSRDQGHGWGYRYVHSAWFVLPVLASIALTPPPQERDGAALRAMGAWAVALSLVLANGLRLTQVEAYMNRHLDQVPPLARAVAPERREIVFIDVATGYYTQDLVQNDPFLRSPRATMVYGNRDSAAALMARRFPEYAKTAAGKWGELWTRKP